MKSPFPGMDPYLEDRWPGVHTLMISAINALLQPSLPRGSRARPEERILLESTEDGPLGDYRSDLATIERPRVTEHEAHAGNATVMVASPIKFRQLPSPLFDRFVNIVDVSDNRVITAIEVLSPWNKKPGRLNRDYRRKVKGYTKSAINFVEIDLLRSSRQHLPLRWRHLPREDRKDYLVMVHRAKAEELELYPTDLRKPLPGISVPLRTQDSDVPLDLAAVIERVYTDGGYDDIDYSKPPEPPLDSPDAQWTAELISRAGANPP